MRGSITLLQKKGPFEFILGDDGCELYFDGTALNRTSNEALSVGQWVEYEVRFGSERLRAINIKVLRRNIGRLEHAEA